MEINLDHINLSVENLEHSIQWYQNTFGFELVEKGKHKDTPYAIVRNNESMLCMYELPGKQKPEASETHKIYHFGLRIKDPVVWEKQIDEQKINIHHDWDYPHSKSWYLFDPSGHEIEVCYWHNDVIKF